MAYNIFSYCYSVNSLLKNKTITIQNKIYKNNGKNYITKYKIKQKIK
jgi:hypothetical protein